MRIAVSACLLGEPCRYDGRSKPCAIVRTPWMDGERRASGGDSWMIVDSNGIDRTAAYARGAQAELARAREAGCELAILKAKSPSCGSGEIYDGTFSGPLIPGWGIAASAFRDAGIPVIDETTDFRCLSEIEGRRRRAFTKSKPTAR